MYSNMLWKSLLCSIPTLLCSIFFFSLCSVESNESFVDMLYAWSNVWRRFPDLCHCSHTEIWLAKQGFHGSVMKEENCVCVKTNFKRSPSEVKVIRWAWKDRLSLREQQVGRSSNVEMEPFGVTDCNWGETISLETRLSSLKCFSLCLGNATYVNIFKMKVHTKKCCFCNWATLIFIQWEKIASGYEHKFKKK